MCAKTSLTKTFPILPSDFEEEEVPLAEEIEEVPCPVHCEQSALTKWAACSRKCGGGTKSRTRRRVCGHVSAHIHAHYCAYVKVAKQLISMHISIPMASHMSTRMSAHRVTRQPKYGGLKCGSTSQKAVCNTKPCPVNCKHTKWSAWGKCSKKCGGGTKTKTRTITEKAHGDTCLCASPYTCSWCQHCSS